MRTKRIPSLRHIVPLSLIVGTLIFLRRRPQREFAIGEPVPYSALRWHPRFGDPLKAPALVRLRAEDARRRERPPPELRIPRSLKWDVNLPRTRLAFPRRFLNDVSHFRVVLNDSTPVAMYCAAPGVKFLDAHLATRYKVVPMQNLALRDRERILSFPSVFRFVLAVHPYVRLMSIYRKGTGYNLESRDYRKFMASVRGTELRDDEREVQKVSLRFFVAFLARGQLKGPFVSVTDSCQLGQLDYHLIGKLTDMWVINKRLGLPASAVGLQGAGEILNDMRLRGKVARMYADDMQRFHFDLTRT